MINGLQFEAVYNEFKNLVYNVALHYIQNTEDAQDITQEVFIKVYRNLHKYDPAYSSLKTWIYKIAINQSLDFLKAKKAKKRFGFITGIFKMPSNDRLPGLSHYDHPGIAAENKEELQQLMKLISELPPNQKTAIILMKIEDRTQKEAAEIMGISVKALESLINRAKQKLEKKFKQGEGF